MAQVVLDIHAELRPRDPVIAVQVWLFELVVVPLDSFHLVLLLDLAQLTAQFFNKLR